MNEANEFWGRVLFAVGAITYSLIGAIFARNFRKRRQPASLVVTVIGFAVSSWFCREMHWIKLQHAEVLITALIPIGLLGLLIVINAERQR